MKHLSTDIDREQKEYIDPEHTKHLSLMMLTGIGIGMVCVFGVVLILLNADLIDKIKPQVQLVVFSIACAVFGIIRFVTWIRNL